MWRWTGNKRLWICWGDVVICSDLGLKIMKAKSLRNSLFTGASEGGRTLDLLITNQLLYH